MPTQQPTFQPTQFLSDVLAAETIPAGKMAYFRARLSNQLHDVILAAFLKAEAKNGLTKRALAKRIGRKPEQITRWLASAKNLDIDTVSDLMLGMGFEPAISVTNLRLSGPVPV